MAVKRQLIQFTISNSTDCVYNLPLFQANQFSVNATTKYSWDITSEDLSCGTATIIVNSINFNLSFDGTLSGLINALNGLKFGFFCTETIGGSTYLYTADDVNIYGDLDICGTSSSTTTSTTTTTTTAPTTSTTTTTTTEPPTTTSTTTTTTTEPPTTTSTTTTTTTEPPTTTSTTTTTTTEPPTTTSTTTTTTTEPPTTTSTTTTTTTALTTSTTTTTTTSIGTTWYEGDLFNV